MIVRALFLLALALIYCNAFAELIIKREGRKIYVELPKVEVEQGLVVAASVEGSEDFGEREYTSRIKMQGVSNTSLAHGPSLPQVSFILKGQPKYLKVNVKVKGEQTVDRVVPSPGQPTRVRQGSFIVTNRMSKALYEEKSAKKDKNVSMQYLGDFRGTHLTRVKIHVAKYSSKEKKITVAEQLEISHNAKEFRFNTRKFNKYLIIVPEELSPGLDKFIAWKESQGFVVEVEKVQSDLISSDTIKEIVKDYYKSYRTHFVMLVGTEKMMPTNYVHTGFSRKTPSDLPYFTFGKKDDYIPDVFSARIVAETAEQLDRILWKSVRYELGLYGNTSGYQNIMGVASSEGKNPSDNEYISSIGQTFSQHNQFGMAYNHFSQNDPKSARRNFNKALNRGVAWLTYMGHGNGVSWPSFYQSYKIKDIDRLANQDVVQPIIIDVACQNGKFGKMDYIGTRMMSIADEMGDPMGAVAYYGGSVNISWHPPAIMAKGIAVERFDRDQGFDFLGEGLLLGQLYLAKNWDRRRDVIDNMEWYHLQGDPGLRVRYHQRK